MKISFVFFIFISLLRFVNANISENSPSSFDRSSSLSSIDGSSKSDDSNTSLPQWWCDAIRMPLARLAQCIKSIEAENEPTKRSIVQSIVHHLLGVPSTSFTISSLSFIYRIFIISIRRWFKSHFWQGLDIVLLASALNRTWFPFFFFIYPVCERLQWWIFLFSR